MVVYICWLIHVYKLLLQLKSWVVDRSKTCLYKIAMQLFPSRKWCSHGHTGWTSGTSPAWKVVSVQPERLGSGPSGSLFPRSMQAPGPMPVGTPSQTLTYTYTGNWKSWKRETGMGATEHPFFRTHNIYRKSIILLLSHGKDHKLV